MSLFFCCCTVLILYWHFRTFPHLWCGTSPVSDIHRLTTNHNLCTDSSCHDVCVVLLPEPSFPEEQGVPGSGSATLTSLSAARATGALHGRVPCFCECCQPSMSPLPHGPAGSPRRPGRGGVHLTENSSEQKPLPARREGSRSPLLLFPAASPCSAPH